MCIICTRKHSISHNIAHEHIICKPKSIFAHRCHKFLFLFGVLFIRIFMRLGSNLDTITDSKLHDKIVDFSHKRKYNDNFYPCIVAIATNIPVILMTGFVVQWYRLLLDEF